jgi:hypothetical protein
MVFVSRQRYRLKFEEEKTWQAIKHSATGAVTNLLEVLR